MHTITPSKSGYIFAPITHTVTVPPDATGKDFRARPIPTRFLALPIATTNSSQDAIARVNSWFDHQSPDYGKDYQIRTWQGNPLSYPVGPSDDPDRYCTLQVNCYAGHNGIDFSKREPNKNIDEPVYAAYSGVVSNTIVSNTDYGNRVWINHQNGYATLYGHLKSISVTVGSSINTGQPLGIMGTTGRSTGIHLHFGLYYDKDGNGQWTEDEVVDPYGWFGSNVVWSWNAPAGQFISNGQLWNFMILSDQARGTSGGTLTTPSGNGSAIIPPGALTSTLTLRFGDVPPVAVPSAQLRTTGRSFLLQVLEWLTGLGQRPSTRQANSSFAQPVTLQVTYGTTETLHLDTSQMKIYYWDENAGAWSALSTTIDTNLKTATAQTTAPGNFDLQAPLLCPADTLEIDDNYYAAKNVTDRTAVTHLFDIAQDEDWLKLDTIAGSKYQIWTSNLAAGVDTVLQVYDIDGVTPLASDDNSGGGKSSRLIWQAPQTGTYFIRVSQAPGSAFGCSASYQLNVSQGFDSFFPFVTK